MKDPVFVSKLSFVTSCHYNAGGAGALAIWQMNQLEVASDGCQIK